MFRIQDALCTHCNFCGDRGPVQCYAARVASHGLEGNFPSRDDNPQTEQDIALSKTALRTVGANTIDRNVEIVGTVHALNHLINTLPAINRTGPAAREALWSGITSLKPEGAGATHFDRVMREFSACWDSRVVEVGAISAYTCVQRRHDLIMWQGTREYWHNIAAGS